MKKNLILLLIILLLPSCYHISQGGSSSIKDNMAPVAVPIFKNTTDLEGIEVPVTEAVIRKVSRYGADKVVSVEKARTIIDGTVTGYNLSSSAIDSRHKVIEYRLSITLKVSVTDAKDNEVLYKNDSFVGSYDFKVPRESIDRKREEGRALKYLSEKMASDLVTEIYEGF